MIGGENALTLHTILLLIRSTHSVSLQLGKPWMIEMNAFIRTSEKWYLKPHAQYGGDALLSAFTSLRILSTEIIELVSPRRSSSRTPLSDHLIKLLNDNITRWENHWFPILDDGMPLSCF